MATWIEKRQPYASSQLWQLQRRYFADRGIEAWSRGEVPHYVTSNPTIAAAYAAIVFAFTRDLGCTGAGSDERLTICELGAGSGRFAFHFLRRLDELCAEAGTPLAAFRYVLTDVADANLAFWRAHPRFEPYFARGVLDMACFDVMHPDALVLQISGACLSAAAPQRLPLVAIGNYLFDSVPADLFYFSRERLHGCLVSLAFDGETDELDAAVLLAGMQIHYDYEELAATPYAEPWLRDLLNEYRSGLQDSHLPFPAAGLRCVDALSALSKRGLLLLSADKGEHRLERLDRRPPPHLARHGSVSLPVNYHAFARFCERRGGVALTPAFGHRSIDVIALLMTPDAAGFAETRNAYRRHVEDFGPDGFYVVSKHARAHIAEMSADEMLAYLQLSRHDSHLLARYIGRLSELAGDLDAAARSDLTAALEKTWDGYFPLGEDVDLANGIAGLLYAIGDYERAALFFQNSMAIYGPDTGTLFNLGACFHGLGDDAAAAAILHKVLEYDPANEGARALLADCEAKAA